MILQIPGTNTFVPTLDVLYQSFVITSGIQFSFNTPLPNSKLATEGIDDLALAFSSVIAEYNPLSGKSLLFSFEGKNRPRLWSMYYCMVIDTFRDKLLV